MTEYQLPETSATLAFGGSEWESEWISSEDAYSAEQMQQAYAAGRESMRQECVTRLIARANQLNMGSTQRAVSHCVDLLEGLK